MPPSSSDLRNSSRDAGENLMKASDAFMQAMRHLAGGVAVIATDHNGTCSGLVATAVCSVSADPPTILVCINSGAGAHDRIRLSGRFSVNLLAAGQEPLARCFSGETGIRGEQRFAEGTWIPLVSGAPILEGALVSLDCRVKEIVRMATHSVFFGAVVGTASQAAPPLIYVQGTYGTFLPEHAGLWW
jgi:flavin reductase (DIM6/NTAB) family NADH-FMN oxidoreductase RutF